jgi:hypothetical protein
VPILSHKGILAVAAVVDIALTVHDILCAATEPATGEEPNSELVTTVVLPVLSAAEQEFGQALSRITLDDIVKFASLSGYGAKRRKIPDQSVGSDQTTLTVQRSTTEN